MPIDNIHLKHCIAEAQRFLIRAEAAVRDESKKVPENVMCPKEILMQDDGTQRTFITGSTRDTAQDKIDYEGFLSPMVLKRFAEYMHVHRVQSDGILRDSDNWQKGIPMTVYMKSAWRHFMDWWRLHRKILILEKIDPAISIDPTALEEALCALMFNTMGYLFEILKAKK